MSMFRTPFLCGPKGFRGARGRGQGVEGEVSVCVCVCEMMGRLCSEKFKKKCGETDTGSCSMESTTSTSSYSTPRVLANFGKKSQTVLKQTDQQTNN